MNDAWAVVAAALGAAVLSTFGALGVEWFRIRRRDRSGQLAAQLDAYSDVISRSALLALTANDFRAIVATRSGVAEGIDVVLRIKQPIDVLDVSNLLRRDAEPLYRAVAGVGLIGSRAAVEATEAILQSAGDLIAAAATRGEEGGRVSRTVRGERWTEAQTKAFDEAGRCLDAARHRLIDVARKESGAPEICWPT